MTVLELHYTSAEQGLGGSPGFQFIRLPADLDPGICRQVESLLAYEPPRSAPAQPTPTQIAEFPVALSHTLLADGAAVLCNTTYTGTDYSGRFGNFYAHALYLPGGPGDLGALLPIDTWASPSWRTQPPVRGIPAAQRMEPGLTITREALLAFTGQRGDQLAAVCTDIMNSFHRDGPQVVLAEDDTAAVALWIAIACRSLPRALARRLTFTTYTRRPYQSAQQVIGLLPGTDFSFTHPELTSQYRVHAKLGPSSPAAVPLVWAATAAAIWQAGRPELFEAAYVGVSVSAGWPGAAWLDTLAGRLAATALADGVDVPQPAIAAAVAWTTANGDAPQTDRLWPDLAAGLARSSAQIPLADLGRLCQRADACQPAEVIAPLLSAFFCRLLGEITSGTAPDQETIRWMTTRLHEDPRLAEAANLRDRLRAGIEAVSTAPADQARAGQALLLLRIADAAGVADAGRSGETVLGPALLAGGRAAAEVVRFLGTTSNAGLRTRVLDFLEDAARDSDGRAAGQLVTGASRDWLRTANQEDLPVLHTAVTVATENHPSRMAAFSRAAELLSAADLPGSRYAYGMVWFDRAPTAAEAVEVLSGESAPAILEVPGTAEALIDLVRRAPVIDAETIRLADLLRPLVPTPDPRDRALLDLVAITGSLRTAAGQADAPGLVREISHRALTLLTARPDPGPPRDAAIDALFSLLTMPSRLNEARTELHVLVTHGGQDLIIAFVQRARRNLAGELARSPQLHANCFTLWRLEYGQPGDQAWPAARDSLLADLLAPAARQMDDGTRDLTARLIEEQSPGLGNEWLQLTQQHGAMPRLPWPRLRFRRTR
jgi:hypothetical protein